MKLSSFITIAAIASMVVIPQQAFASNIKEGTANGAKISYLKDADGKGVDFLAIPGAPRGDHRIIVNCSEGKILRSKGENSKAWEQKTASSYCSNYR